MRVLITGGAGFIGSHVAERLIARNDEVLVIDDFTTGRKDNLKPHQRLTLVEKTIVDEDAVNRAFADFKPNVVIHAAASYKDPDNWRTDSLTNVVGTVNVVKAAIQQKIDRLIYFQTALCYGLKPLEQPITLTHPLFPEGSSYAISKTAAESYIRLSGLNFISFRLANAYGPRNLSGPLPTFYHRLSNKKPCFVMDTRRDFIFVDDLVDVVMMAIAGKGKTGIYHVSSGADYAIKDLFDAAVKALSFQLDKPIEIRPRTPDDTFTILLDPSKTNLDFQWKITTPLEVGVKRAVDWYKSHEVVETFTHLKLGK